MKLTHVWIAEHVASAVEIAEIPVVLYGRAHDGVILVWSLTPSTYFTPVGIASPALLPPERLADVPLLLTWQDGALKAQVHGEGGKLVDAELTVVATVRDLQSRHRGVQETGALQGVIIVAIGAGSVVSNTLRLLVQAGVGEVRIADHDIFSPENACRHTLGLDAVGLHKAVALGDQLRLLNPDLVVKTLTVALSTETRRQYEEFVTGATLALISTDSIDANILAQNVFIDAGAVPAVIAGCWERVVGAEILLSDPAAGTPCYFCMRGSLPSAAATKGPIDYSSSTTPENPPQPGLGADVAFVSAVTAKVCLTQLTGDWDGGLISRDRSLLYVGTRAEDVFHQSCQVSAIGTHPDPDCPMCDHLQRARTEVAL